MIRRGGEKRMDREWEGEGKKGVRRGGERERGRTEEGEKKRGQGKKK